jgi:hypothetical protein
VSDNNDDGDHEDDDGKPDKPKKPAQKSDYPVGYGRPPKHTQFKPGQSGNPKGRKEGSKNTSTVLAEELNRRTSVTENGKQQRITKRHVIVKHTVNTAMSDAKVAIAFIQQVLRSEGSTEQPGAGAAPLSSGPEQDRIIEEFLRRVRASNPDEMIPPDDDAGGGPGHYE